MCEVLKEKTVFIIIGLLFLGSLGFFYYVSIRPHPDKLPGNKGFIPIEFSFEDNMENITLPVGSSRNITLTLTSNIDFKATITLTLNFVKLGNLEFFSGNLEAYVLTLEPFGSNSTILTLCVSEDTPPNIQPETLRIAIDSSEYLGGNLLGGVIEIYSADPEV